MNAPNQPVIHPSCPPPPPIRARLPSERYQLALDRRHWTQVVPPPAAPPPVLSPTTTSRFSRLGRMPSEDSMAGKGKKDEKKDEKIKEKDKEKEKGKEKGKDEKKKKMGFLRF